METVFVAIRYDVVQDYESQLISVNKTLESAQQDALDNVRDEYDNPALKLDWKEFQPYDNEFLPPYYRGSNEDILYIYHITEKQVRP